MDAAYLSQVFAAFESWTAAGEPAFQYVAEATDADISIQFIRDWGGSTLGQHYAGLAQIGLGDAACGVWQPYTLRTVRAIALHEIGHALGYDHSEDPASIMFEHQDIEYAFTLNEHANIPPAYVQFFAVCTVAENATYRFDIKSDIPLNMYIVKSVSDFEDIADGRPFAHYPNCSSENALRMYRDCTIATSGGLVLENESSAEDANVQVRIQFLE